MRQKQIDCILNVAVRGAGYEVEVCSDYRPYNFSISCPSRDSLLAFMEFVEPHSVAVHGDSKKDVRKVVRTLTRRVDPASCRVFVTDDPDLRPQLS
jgi:hypothetical protein